MSLLTNCIASVLPPYHFVYLASYPVQVKTLFFDKLAKMPSCNLAERIYNKWLLASGNKGGDLYIAAVDDYIRAFLQVVAYYQYLKGGVSRLGPSKEKLRLRSAQCHFVWIGDPCIL